jgi:outer membrane lipoprotein carrier protein
MWFFSLIAVAWFAQAQIADPSAPSVVAKIQKYYDQTKDLHAKFEQTLESGAGGRAKKASGEVWLKKPGKMRWDYTKPEKKLMVADGTTLWVYEAEDGQALKQDMRASTLPAQVSFLVGQGKLSDEFDASITTVEGLGQPGDTLVKLVPKSGTTAYRYLVFVVDAKSGMVKETMIYDQQGGTNRLAFTTVEQNKGVADGKFSFSPPPGTKIISPPR